MKLSTKSELDLSLITKLPTAEISICEVSDCAWVTLLAKHRPPGNWHFWDTLGRKFGFKDFLLKYYLIKQFPRSTVLNAV